MSSIVRHSSEVSIFGTGPTTMASSNPQHLSFSNTGELRIVLVPTSDDGATISDRPQSEFNNHRFSTDSYRSYRAPDKDIPTHPVSSLQDAFSESLHEVTDGDGSIGKPKLRVLDAKGRRETLLEQDAEDDPFDAAWRYRPGQQQHEMYKLISQITFGVYLLLNSLAADNDQVVTILQGHIDEVDEFLEVMLEDFAQAHKDLTERIAHLQLPMANRQAFEGMLEDRNFRAQILAGNEKIDHILARTNAAMKQWDDDIDAGLRSSEAFMDWLNEHKDTQWPDSEPDLGKIFLAMKGNADGWLNAFDDLNNQAQDLNGLIIKLMTIVAEMEKTAGEVSRKTWATIPPFSLPVHPPHEDGEEGQSSPALSVRSDLRSIAPVASIRSGQTAATLDEPKPQDSEVSTLSDFPLPGGTPLLPPSRVTHSLSNPVSLSPSFGATTPKVFSVQDEKDEGDGEGENHSGMDDGPLYILQPRTYTPQPSPLPSPSVMGPVVTAPPEPTSPQPRIQSVIHGDVVLQKRTSLRQRVAQKTTPPDSIQIPPRNAAEVQASRLSPSRASPQTARSLVPDYSRTSDLETHQAHRLPRASSHADFAPARPNLITSPHSEQQQFYHPVRASPHSPLQQRPHTAGPGEAPYSHPSGYFPGHQRNQPSQMGGMSMLSSVTTATNDDTATVTSRATTQAGGKRLKKKKSAFGWLKKAFSMDDDERAEYEARKAMHYQEQVYEHHSPKFLDGKRIR